MIPLPLEADEGHRRRPMTPCTAWATTCQPVNVRSLSRFFKFALALSAWKKAGEFGMALRSNPSSAICIRPKAISSCLNSTGSISNPVSIIMRRRNMDWSYALNFLLNRSFGCWLPFLPVHFCSA